MKEEKKAVLAAGKQYSRAFNNYAIAVKERKKLYGTAFRVTQDEIEAEYQLARALQILKDTAVGL